MGKKHRVVVAASVKPEANGYFVHITTTTRWNHDGGQHVTTETYKRPVTDPYAATVVLGDALVALPPDRRTEAMRKWIQNMSKKHPDGPSPYATVEVDHSSHGVMALHEFMYEPFSSETRDMYKKAFSRFHDLQEDEEG